VQRVERKTVDECVVCDPARRVRSTITINGSPSQVGGIEGMKHTKAISRRPSKAQSSYASKLEFKQSMSTLILDGGTIVFGSLFFNSLALGTFFEVVFEDEDTGEP